MTPQINPLIIAVDRDLDHHSRTWRKLQDRYGVDLPHHIGRLVAALAVTIALKKNNLRTQSHEELENLLDYAQYTLNRINTTIAEHYQ
jgi:hypothetical protein